MEIIINGVEELIQRLGKLEGVNHLRPPMVRAVARLHRDMADYPPQRPGSSYVRTGTLGRRWITRIDTIHGGLQGSVGNNTIYAPLVQSERFQANVHRGRWQTDEMVAERNRAAIVADFEDEIRKALE